MTVLSLVLAVPLGIFAAIYLVEYAKRGNKLVEVVRLTAETLSGIPSGTANNKDNTVMIKVLMIAGNTDAFSLVYFNSNNCEFKYGTPFTRI